MAKDDKANVDIDELIEAQEAAVPPVMDVDESTIYIFDDIEDPLALGVIKHLKYLEESPDCKEITVIINSNGGTASSAFAICDAMLTCSKPIKTVGIGKIMSAAIPILASGTKGKRFVHKNTVIMIHQVSVSPGHLSVADATSLDGAMTVLMEVYSELSLRTAKAKQKKQFMAIIDKNVDYYDKAPLLIQLGVADAIADKNNK